MSEITRKSARRRRIAREATRERLTFSEILRAVGPGVISGGADNDPAGIATYSIVGATVGFAQNWLLFLSTPMLIVVQQMSAKVGNVTKSDLASLLRTTFGARVATPAVALMVLANVITMGADLLAMGAAVQLLTGIKFIYWIVPLAAVMAGVTIFLDYKIVSKYLLWLVAVFATYILAAVLARPDWGDVLRSTLLPRISLSSDYLLGAVALLGTTITPYLFFWQASGEVEEKRGVQSLSRTNLDIATGMVWSNVTALFIIVATGAVLFSHHAQIHTAADAARALSRRRAVRDHPVQRRHHRGGPACHPDPCIGRGIRRSRARRLAARLRAQPEERPAVLHSDWPRLLGRDGARDLGDRSDQGAALFAAPLRHHRTGPHRAAAPVDLEPQADGRFRQRRADQGVRLGGGGGDGAGRRRFDLPGCDEGSARIRVTLWCHGDYGSFHPMSRTRRRLRPSCEGAPSGTE